MLSCCVVNVMLLRYSKPLPLLEVRVILGNMGRGTRGTGSALIPERMVT